MARYLVPLILFIALGVFLAMGLNRDPKLVPSPLIGKPAPQFTLQTLKAEDKTLSNADLRGKVVLVNVWASWCLECRTEQPFLMQVARDGTVPIFGLNYKDDRPDALRWLNDYGDPYTIIGFDQAGKVGIDWGVYGVPETFVLDKHGIIRHKVVGPITPQRWTDEVLPLIKKLKKEPA